MADDIDIKIRIDDGGAVTVLNNLGEALGKTETQGAAASAGFSKLERTVITLSQGFNLVQNAVNIAGQALSTTFEFIQRGSAVDDVTESFQKMANQAGVLSDTLLNQLNKATADTISNFELMKQANESLRAGLKPNEIITLTQAARALAEETGSSLKGEIDDLTRAMLSGRDAALKLRGVYVDTELAEMRYAAAMGTTRDRLSEVQRLEASRAAILNALNQKVKQSGDIAVDAGDQIDQLNKEWNELMDSLASKSASAFTASTNAMKKWALDAISIIKQAWDQQSKFISALGSAPGANNALGLPKFDDKSAEISKKLTENEKSFYEWASKNAAEKNKILEAEKLQKEISDQRLKDDRERQGYLEQEAAAKDAMARKQQDALDEERRQLEEIADIRQADQNIASEHFRQIQVEQDKAKDDAERAAAEMEQRWEDAAMRIGQMGVDAFLRWQIAGDKVAQQNSDIGGQLGSTVGGLFGQQGAQIGGWLGSIIGSLFGQHDSALTKAKKEADKYFADLFDANRLAVVINGELYKIEDLVFGGDTPILGDVDFGGTGFASYLESLPDIARGAFIGVGTAFEELTGMIDDAGHSLASVFANNIGGSINNLQLLIQATGKSAEELRSAIIEAMLDGKISFAEAKVSLDGIQKVFEKGIPDAVGATDVAWTNFMAAGAKGGRVTIDALQDMAYEAKELGLDFDGMIARLKEQFPEAAEQIDMVFGALRESGIDTIEEMTAATETELIPALATLENMDFPWAESIKDINELIDKVNEIPKEVESNITFNVKTNMDENTRALVDSGYIPADGLPAGS